MLPTHIVGVKRPLRCVAIGDLVFDNETPPQINADNASMLELRWLCPKIRWLGLSAH